MDLLKKTFVLLVLLVSLFNVVDAQTLELDVKKTYPNAQIYLNDYSVLKVKNFSLIDSLSFSFQDSKSGNLITKSLTELKVLKIARGNNALKYAGWGAGGMTMAGLVIVGATQNYASTARKIKEQNIPGAVREPANLFLIVAIIGIPVGAIVGGIIGSRTPRYVPSVIPKKLNHMSFNITPNYNYQSNSSMLSLTINF